MTGQNSPAKKLPSEKSPSQASKAERVVSLPEIKPVSAKKEKTVTIQQNNKTVVVSKPPENPKMNKNQILKENALMEKKIKAQANELKEYMDGLHDSSEFETWRTQMKAKDDAQKEAEVQIRKI